MQIASIVAQVLLIALVVALRHRQVDGRMSPDGQFYLNMTVDRDAPAPYCYRVLVPWVTRLLMKILPYKPLNIMRAIVSVGSASSLVVIYLLTMSFGGSTWVAAAAVVIFVMTDSQFGFWVFHPWLVDPVATPLAAAACLVGPVPAAVFLFFAAASKEAAWALGSVAAVLLGAPWWIPLPGLVLLVLLRLFIKAGKSDEDWLARPFWFAQISKRREWFSYHNNIEGSKAVPIAAVLLLPGTAFALPAGILAVLAWLQTLTSMDQGRLLTACFVWVIPMAVVLCPDNFLALWVLAQTFWPVQREWKA